MKMNLIWHSVLSHVTCIHLEVNTIAEWTPGGDRDNYSSLMWFSMLSGNASIYSEMKLTAKSNSFDDN